MIKKIKVAVVDDQYLFRQGLVSLLKEFEKIEVVMEASNGNGLLEKMKEKPVDIVLLDLEMPQMDGIETTKAVKRQFPYVKIIILTMHTEDEFIIQLIDKGASGFLPKDKDIDVVVDAIYSVMENGYYFDERISKAMVKSLVKARKTPLALNVMNLSKMEIEVVKLICKEFSNKEIAAKLSSSIRTVDTHRYNILEKIGAKNTAGIVMYAVKNNLLD